jgi:hypothetical protein
VPDQDQTGDDGLAERGDGEPDRVEVRRVGAGERGGVEAGGKDDQGPVLAHAHLDQDLAEQAAR